MLPFERTSTACSASFGPIARAASSPVAPSGSSSSELSGRTTFMEEPAKNMHPLRRREERGTRGISGARSDRRTGGRRRRPGGRLAGCRGALGAHWPSLVAEFHEDPGGAVLSIGLVARHLDESGSLPGADCPLVPHVGIDGHTDAVVLVDQMPGHGAGRIRT